VSVLLGWGRGASWREGPSRGLGSSSRSR
jgi:hypothetical protein